MRSVGPVHTPEPLLTISPITRTKPVACHLPASHALTGQELVLFYKVFRSTCVLGMADGSAGSLRLYPHSGPGQNTPTLVSMFQAHSGGKHPPLGSLGSKRGCP